MENKENSYVDKLMCLQLEGTILSYLLPMTKTLDFGTDNNIDLMANLKLELANTKTQYDKPYSKNGKRFVLITKQFEISSQFKHEVAREFHTPNVSNAWLKAYEMFSQFKLFPKTADSFVYFDNAAFPGSFILAANHYVKTQCEIKDFQWRASSILDTAQLEDYYNLYKNYPENWVMDKKNNGDVTLTDNQREFEKRFSLNGKGTVDLYTSDLGFGVSGDFNNQESLHAKANLGQILTGLLTLKDGGNFITKQYTFFEPFTISIIACLTHVFKELKIIKPLFSKYGNSEVYILGLGYQRSRPIIDKLMLSLDGFDKSPMTPVVAKSSLNAEFQSAIYTAAYDIYKYQIDTINFIIKEYERFAHMHLSIKKIKENNYFTKAHNVFLDRWKKTHRLKLLPLEHHLNVKNILHKSYKK